LRLAVSQSVTLLPVPTASILPSGEKARDQTGVGTSNRPIASPESASHSRTDLSSPLEATTRPSGENLTAQTLPV
jgi:hypothetical protein